MIDPQTSACLIALDANVQNTPNKLWFVRPLVTNAECRFHDVNTCPAN